MKEIGSDFFEYNFVDSKSNIILPNVLIKKIDFFISGRMAIFALIKSLNLLNRTVLLPKYTCETVIEPFIKCKCKIIYYGINKDLEPNNEEILDLINKYSPSLILFHSYFGFNTNKKINKIIEKIKEKKVIIVEDLTQSYYSEFTKIQADYYISSLRKFNAIPGGGIIISSNKDIEIHYDKQNQYKYEIDDIAIRAFELKNDYIKYNKPEVEKERFRSLYIKINDEIKKYDDILEISKVSKNIFSNFDVEKIKKQRKINYEYLLENTKNISYFNSIFKTLPEDVVPLYFPIYLKCNRKIFQDYMKEAKIYCPIIWNLPNNIEKLSYNEQYIYDNIICIPCDQRYDINDMKRICEHMKNLIID